MKMEITVNRASVYNEVRECLIQIVKDFESAKMNRTYRIEVPVTRRLNEKLMTRPYKQPIRKPSIVYNLILDNGLSGLEIVAESFTDDLIKKIYEQI